MEKFLYIFAVLAITNVANAEEEVFGGAEAATYNKQILQTSDPFLNKFYNIKQEKFAEEAETSDIEKEKMMLRELGYDFKESDYIKAIEDGNKIAVLRFINAGMPAGALQTYDNSTLFYALKAGQKEVFDILLKKGADIDYINNRSQNLLQVAIELGYMDLINELIESGINLLFVDSNGWSSLHYAIEKKNIELVFLLADQEPGLLNYKNKFGNTPILLALDKAIKNNDRELVTLAKILLKNEEFLNTTNAVGNTSLHFATMLNDYELTKYILELGANPNIKNAKDWRPIDIALKNENVDMANLLRFYGAEL
jgi:ankyrin repeat protein